VEYGYDLELEKTGTIKWGGRTLHSKKNLGGDGRVGGIFC